MFYATITGRIGKDPQVRQAGAHSVCSFSVATERGWGDKKVTTWVVVDVWGKDGENAMKRLSKGARVAVAGEVYLRSFEGREGKREILSMEAKAWELLDAPAPREDRGHPDPDIGF